MSTLKVHNAFGDVELTLTRHGEDNIPPIGVMLRTGQASVSMYLTAGQARSFAAQLVELASAVEAVERGVAA
jgi:hypothetical protein